MGNICIPSHALCLKHVGTTFQWAMNYIYVIPRGVANSVMGNVTLRSWVYKTSQIRGMSSQEGLT